MEGQSECGVLEGRDGNTGYTNYVPQHQLGAS